MKTVYVFEDSYKDEIGVWLEDDGVYIEIGTEHVVMSPSEARELANRIIGLSRGDGP